jgi:hypothetical protein
MDLPNRFAQYETITPKSSMAANCSAAPGNFGGFFG